jgi:cell division septal protein FtsQ
MSGILFLISVVGFVLIAYWAFRNDAMGLDEHGSGLLAMRSTTPKPKAAPKWKKEAHSATEIARLLDHTKAVDEKKPRWNQAFLPGRKH